VQFLLEKWYVDVVASDGRARIAYVAKVTLGALKLSYAAVLRACGDHAESAYSLRGVRLPERGEEGAPIAWRSEALGLDVWVRPATPALGRRVLDGELGWLDWQCLAPRADVQFRDHGEVIAGTGYAEVVTATVPPWLLPWDTLRWGRAHVGSSTVVWLELDGPAQRQSCLYVDGGERPFRAADRERVSLDDDRSLMLSDHQTIREGILGKTVLSAVPDATTLFPGRLLGMQEIKWLSRAALAKERGFAIHECVTWPAPRPSRAANVEPSNAGAQRSK
jgi:hypothetical protein